LVNSEHSTLHPCADLRIEVKECCIRMWSEGGVKSFFWFYCSHCSPSYFTLYFQWVEW